MASKLAPTRNLQMPNRPTDSESSRLNLGDVLGPGLVAGASDDDPSGIATYSQVGAQFGYAMLWVMPFSFPLMAGIQETCADIGRVTGKGIAGNLVRHHPRWIAFGLVSTLVLANVINIAADLAAMASAAQLLVGGSAAFFALMFALVSLGLQVFTPYHRYVKFLKWLSLALLAYVGTVLVAHVNWPEAIHSTLVPNLSATKFSITSLVAVLGTTISPYLFFWQASQEVEEERGSRVQHPLIHAPLQARFQLSRIKWDTYIGMFLSNAVAYFIIMAVAATLHARGIVDIQSADQAAQALRPVAGELAYLLFTIGILGTGLLALPVLAGSIGYAVTELAGWKFGLERPWHQARQFYGIIAISILAGLGLTVAHVNPMKALFWSAVINGVAAGPIMILTMRMASDNKVMGNFCVGRRQRILGWLATAVMLAASVAMFIFWGK